MKVRIKFTKLGAMKFIGHLDLMRYFQRSVRRGNIDVKYSEGMSPHMIMSFASPLGLGLESTAEYMDMELATPMSSDDLIAKLNEQMAEGVQILDARQIVEGKAGKAMSLLEGASYVIRFRNGVTGAQAIADTANTDTVASEGTAFVAATDKAVLSLDELQSWSDAFMGQKEILITKKTKKGERQLDIRPLIYEYEVREDGSIYIKLSAGSVDNIKPELVIEEMFRQNGRELPEFELLMTRTEMYAKVDDKLVSLNDLGTPIEL